MPKVGDYLKAHGATVPPSRLQWIGEHFDGFHKNGQGFVALCPAHDDTNPSLSLDEGKDGRVLMHCHAGCPTATILEIVGLRPVDLMPGSKRIVATYDYYDEAGQLLYQVVRFQPKDFRQRKPDGKGGWSWKLDGVRRVLYRLRKLLASKPDELVFICEGEKDCDRLASLGLLTTTNVGGAGRWRPEYNEHFAGKHIVLLPDNDGPGRQHAVDVVRHLAGTPTSIKLVELPGLPEKGDVSNWLDAGGTRGALLALVERTPPLPNTVTKIIPVTPPEPSPTDGSKTVIKIIPVTPPELGEVAYLGLVGDFLRAVAPYTEATDAGVLAHLLPAIGTLTAPRLHVWAGNKQPARVNTVVVGPTNAGRKGTSFGPVDLLMQRVDPKFWSTQRVNGLSSGEGLIAYVADREEKDEDGETVTVPVEKRLYIVEEEFSRVLANISREGNILSQVIRSCYDNGNLATLTVNPRCAAGAHISITGHITPEELRDRLNHVEMANGFGNRFLWFVVKSDKVMPHTKPIPEEVFLPFERRLRALLRFGTINKNDQAVQLNSAASGLWEKIYPKLREDRPGLAGAMVSRGSAMVLRLALIYALLDCKLKKKLGLETLVLDGLAIRVEHLEAAQAVWEYCEQSARMLFQSEAGDPLADKILNLLRSGSMTRDEFNPHLSVKQKAGVGAALAKLEAAGLVRKEKVAREGAGRPTERWERV